MDFTRGAWEEDKVGVFLWFFSGLMDLFGFGGFGVRTLVFFTGGSNRLQKLLVIRILLNQFDTHPVFKERRHPGLYRSPNSSFEDAYLSVRKIDFYIYNTPGHETVLGPDEEPACRKIARYPPVL